MQPLRIALVVVATSPADFYATEHLARVLQQHAAVVVAYDDKRHANATLPRCQALCPNLEAHLVRIPLPASQLPLWVQGAVRPAAFCGIRRHDLAYSATTRWRVLAPLVLGLVYRYDFVGWTDTDVVFSVSQLHRMFPLRLDGLPPVDALHTGIMQDDVRCEWGVDAFWGTAMGRAPVRRYSWYGNLVLFNSSYWRRIAHVAFAWYYHNESWRYRWGDQQFAGILQLTNATVVDASVWRDRGYFVHDREAPHRFRRYQVRDPTHIRLEDVRASPVPSLADVARRNAAWRASVAQSPHGWITPQALERSVYDYGLSERPLRLRALLRGPEGPRPLQHDLITWLGLATAAQRPLDYLEIGVSVLKCMTTQVRAWTRATLTAYDVEEPNPTMAQAWGPPAVVAQWPQTGPRAEARVTKPSGAVVTPQDWMPHDTLRRWPRSDATHDNVLYYVASDATQPDGWKVLREQRAQRGHEAFNLVLSDGLHTPEALRYEVSQLTRQGMLPTQEQGPLTIVWDDCQGRLQTAVVRHVHELRRAVGRSDLAFHTFRMPGWIGAREAPHGTCVLTSLSLPPEVLGPGRGTKKR